VKLFLLRVGRRSPCPPGSEVCGAYRRTTLIAAGSGLPALLLARLTKSMSNSFSAEDERGPLTLVLPDDSDVRNGKLKTHLRVVFHSAAFFSFCSGS